ncbi:MAG: VWA domain-containing protein [Actinomycetia bacterium]|nr:VWA domain-containing protein [Actinomycetes bacterium]
MRRLPGFLAALVAFVSPLVVTGGQADAQQPPNDSDHDLDGQIQILDVEEADGEIILEVAVPPSLGRPAPSNRHFGVTDGGQLVDVMVAPADTAAKTVLVIDTSGSMKGPALAAAKAGARSFINSLPDDAGVGLVSFGESVIIHQEPTLDRNGTLANLEGLDVADGETALWDALIAAADLVGDSEDARSSVVVLSDGDDTVSSASASDVSARLGASSAILYAVAIESPDTDLISLEETVEQVGGQFLTATDINELGSLYTDIAGRLANRYLLRFTPAHLDTRQVVVSVAVGGVVAKASTTISGGIAVGTGPSRDPASSVEINDLPLLGPVLGPVAVSAPGLLARPTMLWVGAGSMFVAFAFVGLAMARPSSNVRLATASGADRLAVINARLAQSADRLISRNDRGRPLDARLDAAGIDIRPGEFVLAWLLGTSLAWLGISVLVGFVPGVLVIMVSASGAFLIISFRANRRRSRFADQLTETLGIMASSLRAGQSLPQSIELVASETPSPTAEQFHRIHFETRVGRDLTDSMRELAHRMESRDLDWLAQAVDIHRELGGDLTEILDNVATTIRERQTVARQINAMSAEGRATGWVLLAMPIVLFLFAWWRTPDSVNLLLTEPAGRMMLAIAVTGMTVGHFWIRYLVRLRF